MTKPKLDFCPRGLVQCLKVFYSTLNKYCANPLECNIYYLPGRCEVLSAKGIISPSFSPPPALFWKIRRREGGDNPLQMERLLPQSGLKSCFPRGVITGESPYTSIKPHCKQAKSSYYFDCCFLVKVQDFLLFFPIVRIPLSQAAFLLLDYRYWYIWLTDTSSSSGWKAKLFLFFHFLTFFTFFFFFFIFRSKPQKKQHQPTKQKPSVCSSRYVLGEFANFKTLNSLFHRQLTLWEFQQCNFLLQIC